MRLKLRCWNVSSASDRWCLAIGKRPMMRQRQPHSHYCKRYTAFLEAFVRSLPRTGQARSVSPLKGTSSPAMHRTATPTSRPVLASGATIFSILFVARLLEVSASRGGTRDITSVRRIGSGINDRTSWHCFCLMGLPEAGEGSNWSLVNRNSREITKL